MPAGFFLHCRGGHFSWTCQSQGKDLKMIRQKFLWGNAIVRNVETVFGQRYGVISVWLSSCERAVPVMMSSWHSKNVAKEEGHSWTALRGIMSSYWIIAQDLLYALMPQVTSLDCPGKESISTSQQKPLGTNTTSSCLVEWKLSVYNWSHLHFCNTGAFSSTLF